MHPDLDENIRTKNLREQLRKSWGKTKHYGFIDASEDMMNAMAYLCSQQKAYSNELAFLLQLEEWHQKSSLKSKIRRISILPGGV